MKKIVAASLLTFMALNLSADHSYRYQITPYVGKNFADSDSRLRNSDVMYGIRGTYYENSWYGWQLGYEGAREVSVKGEFRTVDMSRLYLNLVVDGEEEMKITPYILLGGGYEMLSKDVDAQPDQAFMQAGLGFKYRLTKMFNLSLEGRALYKFDTEHIDYVTSFGVGMMLGYPQQPKPHSETKTTKVREPKPKEELKPAKLVVVENHKATEQLIPMPSAKKVIENIEECKNSHDPHCIHTYRLKILFDYDKADIKKAYRLELEKVVEVMKKRPDVRLEVEGHTDSIGTYEYNQKLSQRRADAIKRYLVSRGIESVRIEAIGYGEKRPIATNMYKAGRAKNRRVVAKFLF
ncbi:MAG: hypothetical protein B6D59_01275 [Campylobacteraceae bacterium 4484_4]|nr:MAG: hypothetical protein B6D59_01275 [Campylobacteraceae bacterium 4484_4]